MNRVFYVNELNSLVENVHTMGVDVLATLDKVIKNMENKDAALAQQIMANDDYFDNEELAIEKQCFKLLLLQAPVASDLREIASILKLVGDLERIADHCSDISQYTLNLTEMKPAPLPADFLEMMKLMRSMVSDSITAIHGNDAELAQKIIDKDKCIDILNKTVEEDFYEDSHQTIFKAMAALNDAGTAVDVTTVTSYLLDHGLLEKSGGVDYLLRLSESVPTVSHSDHYLKILHNKATLRKIIRETTRIAEEAYGDVDNIDEFIDDTEKTILKVTQERSAGEFRDIRGVIRSVTDRLNLLQKIDGNISGVKSGFRDLDKITSGFQKGDLIILAARPAMGKTAFALNIAHNAAFKSEEPVAIFSLEMPAEQLVQRIICSMGGIEGSSIRTGEILKTNANRQVNQEFE